MLTLAPAIMLGGSASVLAAAAVTLRHGRRPARPANVSCPQCWQAFGGDNLRGAARITYRWKPARGYTITQLNLPRSTFLTACPHCAAVFEITPDGTVFQSPKTGVLSSIRTGKLSITPAMANVVA